MRRITCKKTLRRLTNSRAPSVAVLPQGSVDAQIEMILLAKLEPQYCADFGKDLIQIELIGAGLADSLPLQTQSTADIGFRTLVGSKKEGPVARPSFSRSRSMFRRFLCSAAL